MKRRARVLVGLALALAPGCIATHTIAPVPLGEPLAWLHEGATTRAEIVERLGEPGLCFEEGRIATWPLTPERALAGPSEFAPACSLVVVFGEGERAERVRVVQLW